MAGTWRDLDITKDEVDRIGKALKNEEFRKLLVEYCDELADPATRKQYEEDITLLEKERGVDVTFINPDAGHVIKTSVDGNKIAFVNVCTNVNVHKPTSKPSAQDGSKGMDWSLPHFLSPPRDDFNKKGEKCIVYDVIFHPDVLQHASKSTPFQNLVNTIACEAVESNYNINLDKANLKFPKMKFKGVSRPLVIRKKTGMPVETNPDEETIIDKLYSDMYKDIDKNSVQEVKISKKTKKNPHSVYATPKYLIKHRSDVDIQDCTNLASSHMNAAIPKELIIEINLPLLKTSADVVLDVTEKTISLISEQPSKYKLNLTLPYSVNEDSGSAKFEQDQRKLVVTLPVKRKTNLLLSDIGRDDSGVESDNSPFNDNSSAGDNSLPLIEELQIEDSEIKPDVSSVQPASEAYRTSDQVVSFLNPEFHYSLPDSTCHLFNNILVFTLHVKNVDPSSLEKVFNETNSSIHIKFSSLSPSFVPIYYAFYIYLPSHSIDTDGVSIESWDNNVVAQIPYIHSNNKVSSYWAGTSEDCTEEKLVEEPSTIFNKRFNKKILNDSDDIKSNVEVEMKSNGEVLISINQEKTSDDDSESSGNHSNIKPVKKPEKLKPHFKNRCYSESSGDEISTSPTKSILKMEQSRTPASRSVSESSIDEYTWSSFENCASISDSLIPEECEVSSSMKKTVRFNDIVSRQLFRSNSSILGQKKKNQRKSRNKKRAQERRLSESENSEADEKKNKEKRRSTSETDENDYGDGVNDDCVKDKLKIDFKSDLIFDIDM